MKMIYISCNVSTTHIITELLDAAGIDEYQISDDVAARVFTGKHRMNTSVWPGYNNIIFVPLCDDKADEITNKLRQYNASVQNTDELVSVGSWSLDDYFND
ncbi:MAG: hypothetical protein KBB11_01465 [Bacteroidales bacterium]|nr:hypothetical protein [Bacteroidales bacterium]HOY37965.1 hypothetical protein [Bacteroidales bacterium]HQP03178.1 hypothetical protein [Bacteroidales bacterium]